MNLSLHKALTALLPTLLLLSGSTILLLRQKTIYAFMQLAGVGCFMIVVLAHICEALHLFPSMQWGFEHSACGILLKPISIPG